MKFLVFFVLLAFASAWFMAGNRAREQHPLDANGCHTSSRTGVYHCHDKGEPHAEDEANAPDPAGDPYQESYLPPGVGPAPGAAR